MKEHSLKKRYAIKLLANIINGVINAILVAIVPKALGPVAYGQFTFIQNFFIKAIGFLDMGSSLAFFTKLSANQERKELILFYFLYAIFVLLTIALFVYVIEIFGYTKNLFPDIPNQYIFMGLFFGFLSWLTQIFIKISDAYALTVSVELIKIAHKIASLLLILYFIYYTAFDLEGYFYFQYIALISFLLILTWLFIKKNIFKEILNSQFSILHLLKEFIEYCHPLVVYNIVGLIVGFLDIWLLQKYGGATQTGFYGLAYSLAAMCFLFTSAMTPIITREFSKSYAQKDLDQMKRLFYRYIPMLYSVAAYFSVFVSMQSENVLEIFTDDKFKDAYLVLMIMAFYPIHQTYGQLSSSIFYATGQTKLMRNIALFTQPLGFMISFLLIFILNMGAVGLAIKMIVRQLISVNIQLYFNAKFLKLDLKYFIFHQIYSVLLFVVLAFISTQIVFFDSAIISFLISGILYTFFVIISMFLYPKVFSVSKDELKELLKKVFKCH